MYKQKYKKIKKNTNIEQQRSNLYVLHKLDNLL